MDAHLKAVIDYWEKTLNGNVDKLIQLKIKNKPIDPCCAEIFELLNEHRLSEAKAKLEQFETEKSFSGTNNQAMCRVAHALKSGTEIPPDLAVGSKTKNQPYPISRAELALLNRDEGNAQ